MRERIKDVFRGTCFFLLRNVNIIRTYYFLNNKSTTTYDPIHSDSNGSSWLDMCVRQSLLRTHHSSWAHKPYEQDSSRLRRCRTTTVCLCLWQSLKFRQNLSICRQVEEVQRFHLSSADSSRNLSCSYLSRSECELRKWMSSRDTSNKTCVYRNQTLVGGMNFDFDRRPYLLTFECWCFCDIINGNDRRTTRHHQNESHERNRPKVS